ncbi:MAG TPA: LysR family transcriptional regulator [Roseiarcus sp.]|nr:LysR family transcriptional regulator [Roseiarcus sp.]
MATIDPGWELYRSFLAVMREGSLSAAARALSLTQPTVGRHVEALEQALGVALFTRSQRGLRATESALQLRPYADALASAAAALARAASDQSGVKGAVRVTASEVVGAEVLPPILGPLREAHPELAIELALTNRVEDLLNRDADIAVRMVRPAQGALIARHIGAMPLGLYARRDYLDRHGEPKSLAELSRFAFIGVDRDASTLQMFKVHYGDIDRNFFALRTDNQLAQLAAIRAGFGVGVCQVGLAKRDPALVRLLADQFEMALDIWLAMHQDLKATPRCRVAFDALAEGLTRYVKQ